MNMTENELIKTVLKCKMEENEGGAATVGIYLINLLKMVWSEGEGFDGKRPFGNSCWEFDIYIALSEAGLIDGLTRDEDGYIDSFSYEDQNKADALVMRAIEAMYSCATREMIV